MSFNAQLSRQDFSLKIGVVSAKIKIKSTGIKDIEMTS